MTPGYQARYGGAVQNPCPNDEVIVAGTYIDDIGHFDDDPTVLDWPEIHPIKALWIVSYGDLTCDGDSDGFARTDGFGETLDCNDENSATYPGAVEICDDGIDQDCDDVDPSCDNDGDDNLIISLLLSYLISGDVDRDSYLAISDGGVDCNDNDVSIYPGAGEVCGDGIDQDCSGSDTSCDTDGDGVNDIDEIAEGSDPNDPTSVACIMPISETDWTITSNCTLMRAKTWAGDLYVQNGSVMAIPASVSLDMDFGLNQLVVQNGSGVLIEQGGSLR